MPQSNPISLADRLAARRDAQLSHLAVKAEDALHDYLCGGDKDDFYIAHRAISQAIALLTRVSPL